MIELVSLNVERSRHVDRVVPFLGTRRPDVACLQELAADDLARIQSATGLAHCHYVPMAVHPKDGRPFGVGILSRQPFAATACVTYAGSGDGTLAFDLTTAETRLSTSRYVAARVALDTPAGRFEIATTHFPWSPGGEAGPYQEPAARALIGALAGGPLILTGDFNAPRGGPIFAELASVWRDCVPPDVTTSLDPKLHRAGPLELMVDGLFLSPEYEAQGVRLHDGLSDHQAITATITRRAISA